jgi:hypothetical protein
MSAHGEDPHCPECGEPIGQTATYCMHCSADLTAEQETADTDADETWEQSTTNSTSGRSTAESPGGDGWSGSADATDDELLDPDGLVDNTLTVLVGLGGGLIVGLVATIVLGVSTESVIGFGLGLVVWVGATAYLVRRRTVQGAVAKTGYAIAVVLLAMPLITLSPATSVDGGIGARLASFGIFFVTMLFPAAFAAGIGWVAARFVPDELERSEG